MKPSLQSMLAIAKPLKYLFILGAVVSVTAAISGFAEVRLLRDIQAGAYESQQTAIEAASSSDLREKIISYSQIALLLIMTIVFSTWVYRANVNVRASGAENLRMTPGWAVGWFFVPFFNYWKPYQAMSDLWRASKDPLKWREIPRGIILPLWWFFWLLSSVLSQFSLRLTIKSETIPELINASIVAMVADLVDLPGYLAAFVLVTQISRFQENYSATASGGHSAESL
jgi:hypothetical protein